MKDLPPRKVYDRVRNYYRYKLNVIGPVIDVTVESPEQRIGRTVDTPDLSSEDDDELFTSPSTASMISGCEKVFTCDDVKKLSRLCSSIIRNGKIGEKIVSDTLEETDEGTAFLREFGLNRIINRLKYEGRNKNKK